MAKKKSKLKRALKKIGKAALVAGAGYAAMKALKNRKVGKENEEYLKTEGGDKSDMRDYGPYSNKAAPKTRSNASIAGDFLSKIKPKNAEYGMQFSNDLVNYKPTGRKRVGLEQAMSNIDMTPIKQYKSGGRVKGCGKALRGFGKAMKKGNR
mgnify:FL=1